MSHLAPPTADSSASTPCSTPPRPQHHHVPLPSTSHELFRMLEAYPWESDPSFLDGLQAILGPSSSTDSTQRNGLSEHAEDTSDQRTTDLTLRARCFYYTRAFDQSIDYDAYSSWRALQPAETLNALAQQDQQAVASNGSTGFSSAPNEPSATDSSCLRDGPDYPHSFAEIMHFIQTDQPIPGVCDVPETILEGQGTESHMPARLKPWERSINGSSNGRRDPAAPVQP